MLAVIATVAALILALLLLGILTLLLLPTTLEIRMDHGEMNIFLSFLGFKLYRYPEKKKLQKRPQKATKSQKNGEKSLLSLPQSTDPEVIFAFLQALLSELTSLFPHTNATLHRLWITPPAASEAAMAALWHTGANAGAAAFLELLDQNTKFKIKSADAIRIPPNFTQEKAAFSLHLTLSVKGYRSLAALGSLGKRLAEIQG